MVGVLVDGSKVSDKEADLESCCFVFIFNLLGCLSNSLLKSPPIPEYPQSGLMSQ